MKIRPLNDVIVCKVWEAPKRLGGIELSEEAREAMMQRPIGEVVAVGPAFNAAMSEPIKIGDIVVFKRIETPPAYCHGADGKIRFMLKPEETLGIVESDEQLTASEYDQIEARAEKLKGPAPRKRLVLADDMPLNGNQVR